MSVCAYHCQTKFFCDNATHFDEYTYVIWNSIPFSLNYVVIHAGPIKWLATSINQGGSFAATFPTSRCNKCIHHWIPFIRLSSVKNGFCDPTVYRQNLLFCSAVNEIQQSKKISQAQSFRMVISRWNTKHLRNRNPIVKGNASSAAILFTNDSFYRWCTLLKWTDFPSTLSGSNPFPFAIFFVVFYERSDDSR